MRFSSITAIAIVAPFALASPVEFVQARAAKATTTVKATTTKATSTSYSAAFPYTASVCAVTAVPSPNPVFHCNSKGNLTDPAVIINNILVATYDACASLCEEVQSCISFGYNQQALSCVLYSLPLTYMGLTINNASPIEFANRHCFDCYGGTTISFTVLPTAAPTTSSTAKVSATATATSSGTKKASSTKTTASPTTTYTAGAVNIVSGGNFTNKSLGGFQVSLSSATGSFQQLGFNNYAYCCTSQLLGLDAVCVLSQNLKTTFGTAYNFGFEYLFQNKIAGLSTIVAPFQTGLIQEVLAGAGTYQSYGAKYFALTDPSLFSIVMDVPLGGNSVCISDISVTAA